MLTRRRDACFLPDIQGNRIITESNADIFDHPVNLIFNSLQLFFIQRIKEWHFPLDIGRSHHGTCRIITTPFTTLTSRHHIPHQVREFIDIL